MASKKRPTPDEFLSDPQRTLEAVRKAGIRAAKIHRALGEPMASWQDGQVVWIAPEDLPIPEQ